VLVGYSFEPAYRSVSVTTTNVAGVNFVGGYQIQGRIADAAGKALPNLRVYRTGGRSAALTNSAGYFKFYGIVSGTYIVTPDPTSGAGYGFTPENRSVTVAGASISGQNFTARPGYSISGRIISSSGSALAGVVVTRSGSATSATTNTSGYYTFAGVTNGIYTVTPNSRSAAFSPATRNITVAGANVANQNFIGTNP
jgi:hypothetical protein